MILDPHDPFEFSLLPPVALSGGYFFIQCRLKDTVSPLYIQVPKCTTKTGIYKNGKRFYCDLLFSKENYTFVKWMEQLHRAMIQRLVEHRDEWFDNLESQDIEDSFTSPLKIKSGNMHSTRTNVPSVSGQCTLKIYNEQEAEVPWESLNNATTTDVIPILEIQGIKFSSRTFQIETEIKQLMILKNPFEKCVIPTTHLYKESESTESKKDSGSAKKEKEKGSAKKEKGPSSLEKGSSSNSLEKERGSSSNSLEKDKDPVDKGSSSLEKERGSSSNSLEKDKDPVDKGSSSKKDPVDKGSSSKKDPVEKERGSGSGSSSGSLDKGSSSSTSKQTEKETKNNPSLGEGIEEIDLAVLPEEEETFVLKRRNDIYYEIYREAKRKAAIARDLALTSYLEAKHIKNIYMLEDDDDDVENALVPIQ